MKKIYDKNLINKVKEEYKIDNYFSKEYEFIVIEYEEDETIIEAEESDSNEISSSTNQPEEANE